MSSTFGLLGWRCHDDQYLRPLSDRILATTPSPIVDYILLNNERSLSLLNQMSSSRSNSSSLTRLPILVWCRDEQLRLLEMTCNFPETDYECVRQQQRHSSKSTIDDCRLAAIVSRTCSSSTFMHFMDNETSQSDESDFNDIACQDLSIETLSSISSVETSDENDTTDRYVRSMYSFNGNKHVSFLVVRIIFSYRRQPLCPLRTSSHRFETLTVIT
jgi:hypothetical protein